MPFGLPGDPNERWKVERGVIAHIFVVGLHRCIHEKVGDALINLGCVLERCDERTNVLEGSATHYFRGRVQQESIVELLQALRVAIHRCDFGDLRDNIGTSFADFPFFILGETVVQGEKLLAEHVSGDILRHVSQVLRQCAPDTGLLVQAHRSELVHNIAFINLLAHVTRHLVQQFDCRLSQFVIFIVCQIESQSHNVLFPVFLHHRANLRHDLNCTIPDILFLVVEQTVKQWENCATDLLVAHLTKIFRDKRHQGRKLIQKSLLNISKLILSKLLQCW